MLTSGCFFDPLIDDEATVLAIRAKAMSLAAEGKTVMSWVGEGTQANKEFTLPIDVVLRETRWYLKSKNPGKYGPIAQTLKVIFQ